MVRLLLPVLLLSAVSAQKGIPSVCPYPVTWDMKRSTLIMPCNESGFTDPLSTVGWGIVDFDWSNAKAIWAAAKPMNCEEMLVEQVKKTTTASPGTTVWVYRNGIKASGTLLWTVMHGTAGQQHALSDCYGQHRRPVARSN